MCRCQVDVHQQGQQVVSNRNMSPLAPQVSFMKSVTVKCIGQTIFCLSFKLLYRTREGIKTSRVGRTKSTRQAMARGPSRNSAGVDSLHS